MEAEATARLLEQLRSMGAGPELLVDISASVALSSEELQGGGRLLGGWVEASSELFTCWLATRQLVGMHQRSRNGLAFTLTVHPARVRRVVTVSDPEGVILTVELDADRQTHVPGDSGQVVVMHAGYELRAAAAQADSLLAFARALRVAMGGTPTLAAS